LIKIKNQPALLAVGDFMTAADLYPEIALRWNSGVNNWMIYGMGDVPIRNRSRFVNTG
jgi:hypothetical protein